MKKILKYVTYLFSAFIVLVLIDAFTFGYTYRFLKHVVYPPAADPSWVSHEPAPYMKDLPADMSAAAKANYVLDKMTFDEKIRYLSGYKEFGTLPVKRLNLPPVWFADATSGVRRGLSTAFPVNVAMTASFNRQLIKEAGKAIAEEARAKGISVMLGPGMNIYRVPTNGRNFEYMGEDPFLAGSMAVEYIKGMQSRGVIAVAKHLAANNSDYDRHRMSSDIDERTLREIYLPAFRMSVKEGGVQAIMAAYNPVNGVHASENRHLIEEILRAEWGFNGFVMSDWNSVYSVRDTLVHGVDIEMPSGRYLNADNIRPLLEKGAVTEEHIDRKIFRMLHTFFRFNIPERPVVDNSYAVNTREHAETALNIARESIVLLKNERDLLPLEKGQVKKIAVLGPLAVNTETTGGGSSGVVPVAENKKDILTALREKAPEGVSVEYAGSLGPFITGSDTVSEADAVIVSVGFTRDHESEMFDKQWDLPGFQESLIRSAYELNRNTIVVLTTGAGPETASWINSAPALVHSFFLGQSVGQAVAEVIYGEVNPSGKLPYTMAEKWNDIEAVKYYVDTPWLKSPFRLFANEADADDIDIFSLKYKEKLMVGYRHFDTNNVEPVFEFGYGLSYTGFEISDLRLSQKSITAGDVLKASVKVSNTGKRAGAEVVQFYVHDVESSLPRPEKELKGFYKTALKPGESKRVEVSFDRMAFSYYDTSEKKWVAEPGDFIISAGNSSRNISESLKVQLK